MKRNILILTALSSLFFSCYKTHLEEVEYFGQDVYEKVTEYSNGFKLGTHDVFNIYLERKDTLGQQHIVVTSHINYNHTLDTFILNDNIRFGLPIHFVSDRFKTSLSSDKDQTVSFEIRSKTPQNEVMKGHIIIAKDNPITAENLGNNTFKITWKPQDRRQNILINVSSLLAYTPLLNGYAVETVDDGEHILDASIFKKIRNQRESISFNPSKEPVSIKLTRKFPQRLTVVEQPSTGVKYSVYGGDSGGSTTVDVLVE